MTRPRWIVCEDGDEYIDRFRRFLGGDFDYVAAADAASLLALAREGSAVGLILDLDFRRTPTDRLVDEEGLVRADLTTSEKQLLAETQGILILRALRRAGLALPALLFADLPPDQAAWLEATLMPVTVVPSHEGLATTAERMRAVLCRR